eukprot:1159542-Pelagomonas_calceolata.AAC.12
MKWVSRAGSSLAVAYPHFIYSEVRSDASMLIAMTGSNCSTPLPRRNAEANSGSYLAEIQYRLRIYNKGWVANSTGLA